MRKLLFLFFLFLAPQLYAQRADSLTRTFEFRIFDKGKQLVEKKNKVSVESVVYVGDWDAHHEYQSLKNTSKRKGQYLYSYTHEVDQDQFFYLKIYSGRDSMIILTDFAMDSLVFQPGEYYYAAEYVNYFNIKPVNANGQMRLSNPHWNKVIEKRPGAQHSFSSYVTLPWLNHQFRNSNTDTTLQYVYYPFSNILILPEDSSIYLYYSFRISRSTNLGDSWEFAYECKSGEDIKKLYYKDGKTRLIISRFGKDYDTDLETFLRNGELSNALDKPYSRNSFGEYEIDVPDTLRFLPISYDYENQDAGIEVTDSCLVYYKYKGERLLSFQCRAHIPYRMEDPIEWDDSEESRLYFNAYYNAKPENEYVLGNRIFMAFSNCFLYSDNGKEWTYYSMTDLYHQAEYLERREWLRDHNLEVYLLRDKRLLLVKRDYGVFLLNVK